MKSINYVIVEIDQQYKNEVKFKSGVSIIVNTRVESVENINRVAKVVSVPDGTVLKKGDYVVIHHNILRKRGSQKGNEIESEFYIKENTFFVPFEEVFMYKRGEDEWKALSPHCFIKPIEAKDELTSKLIYIPESLDKGYKGMKKNQGFIAYGNPSLEDIGASEGDEIIFQKDSEYEIELGGQIYYKMSTQNVLGKVEHEGS